MIWMTRETRTKVGKNDWQEEEESRLGYCAARKPAKLRELSLRQFRPLNASGFWHSRIQASSDDQISKAKLSTAYRASFCFVHTAARREQSKSRHMAVAVEPSCSKNFNQIASATESYEPP